MSTTILLFFCVVFKVFTSIIFSFFVNFSCILSIPSSTACCIASFFVNILSVLITSVCSSSSSLSGRLRATDSERARGGGSGTRARASLSGFRGMTGSRPAQRTVWTNPALWSATNQGNFFFSGQGPVGGAGILHGRRAVRAHFRTAARTRWAGSESGRKKVVERGEAGL